MVARWLTLYWPLLGHQLFEGGCITETRWEFLWWRWECCCSLASPVWCGRKTPGSPTPVCSLGTRPWTVAPWGLVWEWAPLWWGPLSSTTTTTTIPVVRGGEGETLRIRDSSSETTTTVTIPQIPIIHQTTLEVPLTLTILAITMWVPPTPILAITMWALPTPILAITMWVPPTPILPITLWALPTPILPITMEAPANVLSYRSLTTRVTWMGNVRGKKLNITKKTKLLL